MTPQDIEQLSALRKGLFCRSLHFLRETHTVSGNLSKAVSRFYRKPQKFGDTVNCVKWEINEVIPTAAGKLRLVTSPGNVSRGSDISCRCFLTLWGRVMHICVSRLTITGSNNGLSPGRRQAIIWTNVGILLIGPLGINFSGNLIEILTFSLTKMILKVSSAKWRPFCLGLNVLKDNNQ